MTTESWIQSVGITNDSERREVEEFGLDNGSIRLAVWTYGATLVEVLLRGGNESANVVVRLPDLAAYENKRERFYIGSTIGRFARIVAGGKLVIDGQDFQLTRNAGSHHIHGGVIGFDARVWDGTSEVDSKGGRIVLTLDSPHGDQGYPGELKCVATFELIENELTIRYEAVTDRPTLCGISSHAFWNLAGRGRVDGHLLQLNANSVVETNDLFVPSGRLIPIAGTAEDFRVPRRLGANSLDHCFTSLANRPAARLWHPRSGRNVAIHTNQPALAAYTGDSLPNPRPGLCIQPGPLPDACNQPSFSHAFLRPEESYLNESTYILDNGDQDRP